METNPATVLVIENHPMMRAALCAAIAAEPDLKVAEAAINGEGEGLLEIVLQPDTLLLPGKPDLILLAIDNPGWTELESLGCLRKSLPGTPILALTSNEVEGQEQAALEAGAQAVLTKAASRARLVRALRALRNKEILNHSVENLEKEAVGKNSIQA
jgi:DNA-binding NarL/FixJ family response regulator